jgi:O-acetyl-ADP-ribose deacetylase
MPPKEAAPVRKAVYEGVTVEVIVGDMTTFEASAIVNAANRGLGGGGGIDGQIHRAAGRALRDELEDLFPEGGEVGEAYTTYAHNINTAEYIIHAIGPNYKQVQGEAANNLLRSAYTNSLARAAEISAGTLAFPTISTGIFAFPIVAATGISLRAVRDWIDDNVGDFPERVVFLMWGTAAADLEQYRQQFQ